MTKISYINGEYLNHDDAVIHIDDRGNVFSDGVYEVAMAKGGVLIDWVEHCNRLQNSIDGLKIGYQVSMSELELIARELLGRNKLSDAIIYLQISRGVAPRNHPFPSPAVKPTVIMTASQFKPLANEYYTNGVRAITTEDLRWKRRDLKTISLLPNVLAKQEAVDAGAEEAILVDGGKITEGSATNFFIVDGDGNLRTHPQNQSILGGITRNGVIKVANDNGVNVIEEAFTKDQMEQASEAFITSTTKHILPIVNIDGNDVGGGKVGEVTKRLMELYRGYIDEQG